MSNAHAARVVIHLSFLQVANGAVAVMDTPATRASTERRKSRTNSTDRRDSGRRAPPGGAESPPSKLPKKVRVFAHVLYLSVNNYFCKHTIFVLLAGANQLSFDDVQSPTQAISKAMDGPTDNPDFSLTALARIMEGDTSLMKAAARGDEWARSILNDARQGDEWARQQVGNYGSRTALAHRVMDFLEGRTRPTQHMDATQAPTTTAVSSERNSSGYKFNGKWPDDLLPPNWVLWCNASASCGQRDIRCRWQWGEHWSNFLGKVISIDTNGRPDTLEWSKKDQDAFIAYIAPTPVATGAGLGVGAGSGDGAGDGFCTDAGDGTDAGVQNVHQLWTSTKEVNVCQRIIIQFVKRCFDSFQEIQVAMDKWTMPSLSFSVSGAPDIYAYMSPSHNDPRRICLLPIEVKPFANGVLSNPSSQAFQGVVKQGVAYVDAMLRQSHGVINPAFGFVTDGARWLLIRREVGDDNIVQTAVVQVPIYQLQACITCVTLRNQEAYRAWEDVSVDFYGAKFTEASTDAEGESTVPTDVGQDGVSGCC